MNYVIRLRSSCKTGLKTVESSIRASGSSNPRRLWDKTCLVWKVGCNHKSISMQLYQWISIPWQVLFKQMQLKIKVLLVRVLTAEQMTEQWLWWKEDKYVFSKTNQNDNQQQWYLTLGYELTLEAVHVHPKEVQHRNMLIPEIQAK